MTGHNGIPDPTDVSRREYVKAAVAVGGTAGLAACMDMDDGQLANVPDGDGGQPQRQYAWEANMREDEHGNPAIPVHHVLKYVDLADGTTPADVREPFEQALTDIEEALAFSNEGVIFTVGYSSYYFDRFDESLPDNVDVPEPYAMTAMEDPEFADNDVLVHMASDNPEALLAAEMALFGQPAGLNHAAIDEPMEVPDSINGVSITNVADHFEEYDRRTGFVGGNIAHDNLHVSGIPDDAPLPEAAPLFMGFRAGFREAQASEDFVAIESGPFADGTLQHVSNLDFQLNDWWHQENHFQRVAKMFSPSHAEEELVGEHGERFGDSARTLELAGDPEAVAREEGVIGHAQKAAMARENGQPIILRRDFDSTDNEQAGLHFHALQRNIEDFEKVREALTAAEIADETAVGRRVNNGILQYFFVRRRGNYLVPPRNHRSMPTPNPDT